MAKLRFAMAETKAAPHNVRGCFFKAMLRYVEL
jgi:hypothetical protein